MTLDALDPGPNGDYPNIERKADGTVDERFQPTGLRTHPTAKDRSGLPVILDVGLRLPDGQLVTDLPPKIPGA